MCAFIYISVYVCFVSFSPPIQKSEVYPVADRMKKDFKKDWAQVICVHSSLFFFVSESKQTCFAALFLSLASVR